MTTDVYLFNVDRGQCLAIRGSSVKWYLFDIGCSYAFSPISWIIQKDGPDLSIEQLTLSHYHGDHLGDILKVRKLNVHNLYHVDHDDMYIADCFLSTSQDSAPLLRQSIEYIRNFNAPWRFFYNGDDIEVTRNSLTMIETREIGGSINTRVNNSSVISRISLSGLSILVCGDMESSGWEYIFNKDCFSRGSWDSLIENIDILIAPHHGHGSGFSTKLMQKARPAIVVASVASKNPNIDLRYSDKYFVKGWNIGGITRRLLTTRNDGHIRISVTNRFLQKDIISWKTGDLAFL